MITDHAQPVPVSNQRSLEATPALRVASRNGQPPHPYGEDVIATRQAQARRRFLNGLHAAFDSEPLEDGVAHPAERVIGAALESGNRPAVLGWIQGACLDPDDPAFAAGVLLCIAWQPRLGDATWRAEIVRRALAAADVAMRDAAVQAAETWGDAGLQQVLRDHADPVPWLNHYARGVADDLAR